MGFFMNKIRLKGRARSIITMNWRRIVINKLSSLGFGVSFCSQPTNKALEDIIKEHKIDVVSIHDLIEEAKQKKLLNRDENKQLKQQLKEPQKKNKKKIEYYDGIIIKQKQTNKTKKQPIKHLEQKINVSINVDIKPIGYNQKSKKSEEINKDNFYNTWAWKDIRYQALHKCGRRCMSCGASPLKDNKVVLHVDHIKPFRKYPELALDINNLQVLCEDCNMGKGYWDETDFRTRAG